MTSVDISATHANFCTKFYATVEIYLKVTNYAILNLLSFITVIITIIFA